jgi:5-hydroxyisourate hydrolase-like protein (transthyretin family)
MVVSLAPTAFAADNQPRKIVSGWIPYYSVKTAMPFIKKLPTLPAPVVGAPITCQDNEYSAEDLSLLNSSYLFANKDLMKEVMPFWYTLKSPTLIRDDYTTGNPSWPIEGTLCLMRKSGLKIIPTITDGTEKLVLSGYLAKPELRSTIVKTIIDLVNKYSFDGIDLDFEGFAFVDGNTTWTKTAPNWVLFVKELSAALHAQQKLLSISAPYSFNPAEKQKGYYVYSWAEIASSIDRLRIMTYDYSVAKAGPIGPISWTEKTMQYAISIMPASKVFIGLPGYGRDWITSVAGTCPTNAPPGLTAGAKAATFRMNYANAKAVIDLASPTFDEKSSEATYSYQQSFNGLTAKGAATSCTVSRTVWYQNDRSYLERMNLVAKYRLGGAALWTLGMEDVSATTAMRNVALAIAPDTVLSTLSFEQVNDKGIFYGGVFTVRGMLTLKDKSPAAGIPVSLEIKGANESSWRSIAELTSAADGTVSVPVIVGTSASFRLSTQGTWERAESFSNEEKTVLLSRVILDRPSTVKRGQELLVKGVVLPIASGLAVSIQKLVAGKWQNVGTAMTGNSGEFSLNLVEGTKGVVKLRVQVITNSEQILTPEFSVVVR